MTQDHTSSFFKSDCMVVYKVINVPELQKQARHQNLTLSLLLSSCKGIWKWHVISSSLPSFSVCLMPKSVGVTTRQEMEGERWEYGKFKGKNEACWSRQVRIRWQSSRGQQDISHCDRNWPQTVANYLLPRLSVFIIKCGKVIL